MLIFVTTYIPTGLVSSLHPSSPVIVVLKMYYLLVWTLRNWWENLK